MERTKEKPPHNTKVIPPNPKSEANNILLKKSVFDTKNYYYYFTEVWKDRL